jgi:phosphoribosylaminoimidazolecarboxamide formyltransferase/IMP cyclohydrolase
MLKGAYLFYNRNGVRLMGSRKNMYSAVLQDAFPADLSINIGGQKLLFKKRQWTLEGEVKGLRYGENPDQPAALYELVEGALEFGGVKLRGPNTGVVSTINEAQMLQAGKHPGKTNLTDVDSAVLILQYLTQKPGAAIMKHNNPCGVAWSIGGVADALAKAYYCDRIAAFGGAVVLNSSLDKSAAELIDSAYFEVVAAADFEAGVLDILRKRKNLRIFKIPALGRLEPLAQQPYLEIKALADGGLILQQSFMNRIRSVEDFLPATAELPKEQTWLTAKYPEPQDLQDLLFAWAVESGVISNSIVFAKNGATVAIGAGEQDRVGCVELAIHKAYTKYTDNLVFKASGLSRYELRLKALKEGAGGKSARLLEQLEQQAGEARGGLLNSVMVSDGFFPFRDGVDVALAHGVRAIAQPGGSMRDYEVIAAVNEQGASMVFTGQRSFRH